MAEIVAYYQPLSGHVRAYQGGTPDNMDRFISAASVLWHDATTAEFVGMFGEGMTIESINANCEALFASGAERLIAKRANSHKMPRGWTKVSTHKDYSVWAKQRTLDADISSKSIGDVMQALNDTNTAVEITEIKNAAGELLVRVTREYGAALSTAEALAIEDEFNSVVKKYLPG